MRECVQIQGPEAAVASTDAEQAPPKDKGAAGGNEAEGLAGGADRNMLKAKYRAAMAAWRGSTGRDPTGTTAEQRMIMSKLSTRNLGETQAEEIWEKLSA